MWRCGGWDLSPGSPNGPSLDKDVVASKTASRRSIFVGKWCVSFPDSVEQHRIEVLARIPNARLEIVTGSGHLVPIDESEQLAVLTAQFVTGLSA